ncbi:MAG TPA: methyltransferase domain-containing protein [Deltaproteobacteria bacterium]|nr:methyltransferase domain-containing protein [Deltaproteobacteria bacterium]
MDEDARYLLGHGPEEWRRLEAQHALWGPMLLGDLRRAGVGPGDRVLEVGCGPGFLLEDLARLVGSAEGLELDAAAAAAAAGRLGPRGRIQTGDLRTAELGGPFDVIVARWVLSFLPDPRAAIARLAAALAPGGLLAVHDYNHDGLGFWPHAPALHRLIEAFRAAYRASGGDLWIAARVPGLMAAAGLHGTQLQPHAIAGGPGSPVWCWVETFLRQHAPALVAGGQLTAAGHDAALAALDALAHDPSAVFFSPLQVTVLGRLASPPTT